MSLRSRLALIALTYLVIFFVGAAAIILSLRAWSEDLDERRDLLTAGRLVAQLEAAYLKQQVGHRAYALTGDEVSLEAYQTGRADALTITAELDELATARPALGAGTTAVREAGETWNEQIAEPVVTARQENDLDGAQTLLAAEGGSELFQGLADQLESFGSSVENGLETVTERAEDRRVTLVTVLVVKLVTLLGFTILVGWLSRRWILNPINGIATATKRVMGGEQVPIEVEGPPELVSVARAVDDMQRTISDQRDDAVRARESIEQNALLAMQMRTELTSAMGEYPPGWTVSASLRSAEGIVAGDCYDVSLLSPTEISVIVLDIAGHGALAAMSAFKCKELLKAALRSGYEPGESLMWLSEQDHGLRDSFFTAVIVTVDTTTALCQYANAGHPPPVVAEPDGSIRLLKPTGPLFGMAEPGWTTATCSIALGASLTLFTDGLTEARADDGGFYGEDRIAGVLGELSECDAEHIMKRLLEDLSAFRPGRLADDVTVAVVCHA